MQHIIASMPSSSRDPQDIENSYLLISVLIKLGIVRGVSTRIISSELFPDLHIVRDTASADQ